MRPSPAPRALIALFLAFALASPPPAWGLRVMQPEEPRFLAGMEEQLRPPLAHPELINLLGGLARSFTGNYKLTLVPWQPLPGSSNDWPQWRLLPGDLLQYVPEDLERLDSRGSAGLMFESLMLAASFSPTVVEPQFRAEAGFWALITVLAIPRARALLLKRFPGIRPDFERLDQILYPDYRPFVPNSVFLAYLAGALHEGRRGAPFQWIRNPVILEALSETRADRENLSSLDEAGFYRAVRDRFWPVAMRLLSEDLQFEYFLHLQQIKEFRTELGLSRRQKLYAPAGRLPLRDLAHSQRARFDRLLPVWADRLTEEKHLAIQQRFKDRLARELAKMRDQVPTGLLPPLEQIPFEEEPAGLLGAQRNLRQKAAEASQVSAELAKRLARAAGQAAGAEEDWGLLGALANRLLHETGELLSAARKTVAGNGAVLKRLKDLPGAEDALELAGQLRQANEEIVRKAEEVKGSAARLSDEMRTAGAAGKPQPETVKKLAGLAGDLHRRSESLRQEMESVQSRAEEAELTALEVMSEAAGLSLSKSREGRMLRAAEAIAGWANPEVLRRKAMQQAIAQTLVRALQRLMQLRQRGERPDGAQLSELLKKEKKELEGRLDRLMERFGVPPELREQWKRELPQLSETALTEMLGEVIRQAAEAAEAAGETGTGRLISPPKPFQFEGFSLLKVVPPAEPPPPSAPAQQPPAAVASAERQRGDLDQRQEEARLYQQLTRWERAGVVQAQIPLYRSYKQLRQGLISTASAQLFQFTAMKQRARERTDLPAGDDIDPDNLALIPAGETRLFMEEAPIPKKGEADVLSILLDVSGSMLLPGDMTDEEISESQRAGTYQQKNEEAEKNGTRRIDYIIDLLVTLGEAAAKQRKQKLQISIFSSWKESASRVVKGADEVWSEQKAAEVIDAVLNSGHGGTDDARALREELARLQKLPGRRSSKTVWVFSDGVGDGVEEINEVLKEYPGIPVFGWGLGPGMVMIRETFGPRGIWVPKMAELVSTGVRIYKEQARGGRAKQAAGAEEVPEGMRPAEDGWPLDFPRLHPIQDRPGAGKLNFHKGPTGSWFEVDGIRIDPPAAPRVTLSAWTVTKLQQMWDVYRTHPKGRNNTLLLYGQAGIGKSLYARYLWEIYRAWLRGRAERLAPELAPLKQKVLALADGTRTRVITFNEKLRKADLTERVEFGRVQDENSWATSDLVGGGEAGDQVILSEVNRAGDDVLAELDEPLELGQKTLSDRLARFHPNSRFVAAINPAEGEVAYQIGYAGRHLSGQFLGHFWKVMLDYPRPKLPDGTTDNPEHALFVEHEKQVLREARTGTALTDEVIDRLVALAELVREDAAAGQAPFILTTRALVRMVEQLDRFPHLLDRIPDVFFNSYWVDDKVHGAGKRAHLQGLIERIFRPADWPADEVWPKPRPAVGPPIVIGDKLTYPHWPDGAGIPLGPGTGAYVPQEVLIPTRENLWKLEDLLMDVALKRNIMNMGDTDTGLSYFTCLAAKLLRRNLIVITMSQGFKQRDMLVMRWYSGGKTWWKDSFPLSYMRPDKVASEGAPIIVWDRGEKGDPGILVSFNDALQERRVLLPSGEEFFFPEESVIFMNRTPPRAPYEYEEFSGDFFDRFTHHAFEYLPAAEETEVLHLHHPRLFRGSLEKVAAAANVLRGLYDNQRLFEPPGFGMTFSAAALLAQEPEREISLPDLLVRAYGPIHRGAEAEIRKGLAEAGLNIKVHPLWSPELLQVMAGHPNVKWDPAVLEDPALWGLAQSNNPWKPEGLTQDKIERVLETGEPVQLGWGLELRRRRHEKAELVPVRAGTHRPYGVYAHLGTLLHRFAVENNVAAYRLSEEGIFYRKADGKDWEPWDRPFGAERSFGPDSPEAGLWQLLSSRGYRGGFALTIELPAESLPHWVDLYWALDPVTLRQAVPPARRLQGVSGPAAIKVNGERPLEHLQGFSVGLGEETAPGFLIRADKAGMEEKTAALVRRVPVVGGYISHGDDDLSIAMLFHLYDRLHKLFKQKRTKEEKVPAHLIVVQEVGAPFLAQVLRLLGVDIGQLLEAARKDPDGFERVVRPSFELAMEAGQELNDGWWSQVYAGKVPSIPDRPWDQAFFTVVHDLQRSGYEIHRLSEQPSVEDWWLFLSGDDSMHVGLSELAGPVADQATRKRWEQGWDMIRTAAGNRDEKVILGQLVPFLEEIFSGEEPYDQGPRPLEPEDLAVLIVRGRYHALDVEARLRPHFAEIVSFRAEELSDWALPAQGRYFEALVRGGHRPGEAPAEVEQFLDQHIAEVWKEKRIQEAGLEEAPRLLILTPETAGLFPELASLRGGLPLRVAVIARDDAQEAQLLARAKLGGPVIWRTTNLARTGQSLPQAVASLKAQAERETFSVSVIERFEQLNGLGRFLKVPDVSFRVWLGQVQRRLETDV